MKKNKLATIIVCLLCLILLLNACEGSGSGEGTYEPNTSDNVYIGHNVYRFIDYDTGVMCYVYENSLAKAGGISCLPLSAVNTE